MFDFSRESFSPKEQIVILFKEYDTLRAEIIGRTAGGYQLIAVMAALLAAFLGWGDPHGADFLFWVGVAALCAAGGLFAYSTRRDINMLAFRVREIESEINQLSACEDLLLWETKRGAATGGWIARRQILD